MARSEQIVYDASATLEVCLTDRLFREAPEDRRAPRLMWTEVASSLHQLRWRTAISADVARKAFVRLLAAPIAPAEPRRLLEEAWRVADELGWAKTYDAEYVALARLLECPLVTVDARLRRGAGRVVEAIGLADL